MKHLRTFIFISVICLSMKPVFAQTYDSIKNTRDDKGSKQGYWEENINRQLEKGWYVDNKREGVWRTYYPKGFLHEVIVS